MNVANPLPLVVLLGVVLLGPGCTDPTPPKLAVPKEVTLHVDGMSCAENCAPRVKLLLEAVPGVAAVDVDFEAKTAVCTLDRDIGIESIIGALPPPFTARVESPR